MGSYRANSITLSLLSHSFLFPVPSFHCVCFSSSLYYSSLHSFMLFLFPYTLIRFLFPLYTAASACLPSILSSCSSFDSSFFPLIIFLSHSILFFQLYILSLLFLFLCFHVSHSQRLSFFHSCPSFSSPSIILCCIFLLFLHMSMLPVLLFSLLHLPHATPSFYSFNQLSSLFSYSIFF